MKFHHWQGRIDDFDDPLTHRIHQIISQYKEKESPSPGFVLLGYACDEGVRRNQGRTGAKTGPDAIRQALASLPCQSQTPVYDAGNIECISEDMESAQDALGNSIHSILASSLHPIALGGGHDIAYGHYLGLRDYLQIHSPYRSLGIINIDAHLDIRTMIDGKGNSGTPFYQILHDGIINVDYMCFGFQKHANTLRLIESAKELEITLIDIDDISYQPQHSFELLNGFIDHVDHIYLTIDLDGLSAAHCPGVSAPNAYGLSVQQVIRVIDMITSSGKLLSADIAEMNPAYDQDHITARTAAMLVHRILHQNII